MLDDMKLILRITNNAFDNEIIDLINACLLDLKLSGIKNIDENDPIIKRTVSIYIKANFGLNNSDYDKLNKAYESLKGFLSLVNEYTGEVNGRK